MAAYDSSAHEGVWGHSRWSCRSCNSTWQPADFGPRVERIADTRRHRRDGLIGAHVHARHARTLDYTPVRDIFGTVWSEADSKLMGRKAYWIADGQAYFLAPADQIEPTTP